jgi:hypothetical protein
MKYWWIGKITKMLLAIVVGIFVIGFVVMTLWNALIPDLFKGPMLSYWQATGLLLLSHILLRGPGSWHRGSGWRHEHWRKHFEQRFASMSPEEREKFKNCRQHGPFHRQDESGEPGEKESN